MSELSRESSRVSLIREPDDRLATVRISLGRAPGDVGWYLVFRGTPGDTVGLLREALATAERELLAGRYQDKRGRPQG